MFFSGVNEDFFALLSTVGAAIFFRFLLVDNGAVGPDCGLLRLFAL
jgi:hypothetical protein